MLSNKVVLITGANGGLGAAVTNAFLNAGALVTGFARRIRPDDFPHPNFTAVSGDLATPEDARNIIDGILARHGRLDAAIHLIGGFDYGATIAEASTSTFTKMFDINFYTALHLFQAALAPMRRQSNGALLAIGSRSAVEPAANTGPYNISKAALITLVRSIALEERAAGISANIVLPGTMDTPANRQAMPDVNPATWVQPEQVAAMLVHLASPAARQVTGAVIPIYGAS